MAYVLACGFCWLSVLAGKLKTRKGLGCSPTSATTLPSPRGLASSVALMVCFATLSRILRCNASFGGYTLVCSLAWQTMLFFLALYFVRPFLSAFSHCTMIGAIPEELLIIGIFGSLALSPFLKIALPLLEEWMEGRLCGLGCDATLSRTDI